MPELSLCTQPKLVSSRYRIAPGTSGNWKVLDPENKEVFPRQTFSTANDAGSALIALASEHRIDCLMLYDRRRNIMREARVGETAKTYTDEGCVVLQLNMSPELDADLDNLGEELGVPKGKAILKALSLLKIAMDAKREGKRVAILDDRDDSEQDIIGF